MNLDKMLKKVSNINDYISVTQEIVNLPHSNMKIQFNMSSVLLLKKVRSLEIEYFNKCEGNGAALVLFGRMVEQPASKTWGLLGKELVALLQYWLDAMRKHLIKHSHHWWSFLKLLLKFIKTIRVKDKSLPDILVEGTAECLLDLATSIEPDTIQRHEILYCLNLCCAESSREIRFALRNRLESYFTKLATLMSSCGQLPTQYSMLETLLRWLLPRHETAVRHAAAAKWFPVEVYGKKALEVFLERPWQNFFQDARDFLNALNSNGNLVSSFLCRKISVGEVVVVSGTEKRDTWLDLNASDGSVTVVLDPRLLDALNVADAPAWESLRVAASHTRAASLRREESEVALVLSTTQPPRLSPSGAAVCAACELRLVLSPAANLTRLDAALRGIFADNYQVLLDLDKPTSLSPQERNDNKKCNSIMEEDTRFSHPVEVQRRRRSGFMVLPRNPVGWKSPSTASTSSLAQLHEKLASLPQYKFDKEAVHVCALPELSTVTEVSETDDQQSIHSTRTFKINRPVGVCHRNNKSSDRNSQSDGEVHAKSKVGRYLSPAAKDDENSTSCLLVATIGSADESIINDTLERLNKNKEFQADNIVDLLVREALQKDYNDKDLRDSGINTGDNRKTQDPPEANSEAIENTPTENPDINLAQNKEINEKACTVISNTTTDESNDVVYDTPLNFVSVRKRNVKEKVVKEKVSQKPDEGKIFDVKEVEAFFAQHITENNRGEIVISPTLARKINESSSESEQFEDCLIIHEDNNVNVEQIDVYDIDIIECLNTIVDKVCSDFEKCTELLDRDATPLEILDIAENIGVDNGEENLPLPLKDISNIQDKKIVEEQNEVVESKETDTKAKKGIKLTFNTKRTAKSRAAARKKKNKLVLEPANMSPIREVNDAAIPAASAKTPEQTRKSPSSESGDLGAASATRRKRKLYSPKDEGDNERVIQVTEMDDDKDFKTSKIQTPKYKATSYKDIEMDRQKRLRQPRRRKSKANSDSSPSPRTKKLDDIFNQLKEKVECPDPVKVVDKKVLEKDLAMYNFTSDSEDEDFKRKKIEVQKRISSTTIASGDSTMSTRHGRSINRINYSENKSSDESNNKRAPRQKRSVKRKKTQSKSRLAKPSPALVDEKMREAAPEDLNTSIVVEKPKNLQEEPNLILPVKPQMEPIPDETFTEVKVKPKKTTRKNKKTEALSLKKEKTEKSNTLTIEKDNDDRTISPLPGLNVETIPTLNDEANDSVTANMLQKFRKIYQDGPETYFNESNTTQNLLSDVEKINYSPPRLNITDEFNQVANYSKISDISNENTRDAFKSSKKKTNRKDIERNLSENSNTKTDSAKILRIKKEKGIEMKKKTNDNNQEVINLTKISNDSSEVSIATVGNSPITAHGDSNELPPDSELLTENIEPRDLEVEYWDKSARDYFDRLRSEVNKIPSNESRKDSINSDSTRVLNTDGKSKNSSPVVSIAKLSLEDISKWLPSRRNSDTDYSSLKETVRSNKNVKEHLELADQVSDNENSPIQKIDKISLEFDSSNNDSRPLKDVNPKKKSKNKKTKKIKNIDYKDADKPTSSNHQWLRSGAKLNNTSESENPASSVTEIRRTPEKAKTATVSSQENRKSLISPIKLFDDFKLTRNEASSATPKKKLESIISDKEEDLEEKCKRKHDLGKKTKQNKFKKIEVSTPTSKDSSKIEVVSRLKRKSESPVLGSVKRRKLGDAVVSISESGPSVSSVNEWFRKNAPINRDENVAASFGEGIENVMEKLDTTLIEIHQNTTKKFIHMFVEAQKQLGTMRQERRKMYKSVGSEILAQVVKTIDEKFAELDRRSQEMDAVFMEQLKVQASGLIREDCKKKQIMVSLIREDLSATLARINRKGRGDTL